MSKAVVEQHIDTAIERLKTALPARLAEFELDEIRSFFFCGADKPVPPSEMPVVAVEVPDDALLDMALSGRSRTGETIAVVCWFFETSWETMNRKRYRYAEAIVDTLKTPGAFGPRAALDRDRPVDRRYGTAVSEDPDRPTVKTPVAYVLLLFHLAGTAA